MCVYVRGRDDVSREEKSLHGVKSKQIRDGIREVIAARPSRFSQSGEPCATHASDEDSVRPRALARAAGLWLCLSKQIFELL